MAMFSVGSQNKMITVNSMTIKRTVIIIKIDLFFVFSSIFDLFISIRQQKRNFCLSKVPFLLSKPQACISPRRRSCHRLPSLSAYSRGRLSLRYVDPCLLRDLWAKIPFYIFGIPIVIAVVLIENTPFKEKAAYSDTFS